MDLTSRPATRHEHSIPCCHAICDLPPGLADQHDPALVALSLQNGARLSVDCRKQYPTWLSSLGCCKLLLKVFVGAPYFMIFFVKGIWYSAVWICFGNSTIDNLTFSSSPLRMAFCFALSWSAFMKQSNDANGLKALAISQSNEVRNFHDPSRSQTLILHLYTCIVVAAGCKSGQKCSLCKYCVTAAATLSSLNS